MHNVFEKTVGHKMLDSLPSNVLEWDVDNVIAYIKLWGQGYYSNKFSTHRITGKDMLNLNVLIMSDWGIPMGPAIKIFTAINALHHTDRIQENVVY